MVGEELSQDVSGPVDQERFTVIGSGIIGVLTAHALAEQGHDVEVISSQGKPASLDIDSTSSMAVGQFLPWVPAEHQDTLLGGLSIGEVTDFSRVFYSELASRPHETGVMALTNLELINSNSPWPDGLVEAMNARQEALSSPVSLTGSNGDPMDFDVGLTFDTFSINTRKTVAYLADQAERLGVRFKKARINLQDLDGLRGVIVNATGMGAASLDPTTKINEFKGHTFVVRPKDGHQIPKEAISVEDMVMMPREDGTVVCGALYIENPARPIPEEREADELFERLGETFRKTAPLVEGLEPDFLDNVEILFHSAGYRVEVEVPVSVLLPMRITKDYFMPMVSAD